jgi:broad specificity phosphatase PhoE
MSTLYVIRHGQASYGQADYDRLSPLGVEQARALGEHLRTQRIDALYAGPRKRQRDTATHLGLPHAPQILDGLDEYPAEVIFRNQHPEVDSAADPREIQLLFERAVTRWAAAEIVVDGAGSFADFSARVRGALADVMAREGRGRTVCVVTSAGPTSCAMQMALGLTDPMAMKLSWVVANSSVTELKWREDVCSLISFNTLPHLQPRMVTYR